MAVKLIKYMWYTWHTNNVWFLVGVEGAAQGFGNIIKAKLWEFQGCFVYASEVIVKGKWLKKPGREDKHLLLSEWRKTLKNQRPNYCWRVPPMKEKSEGEVMAHIWHSGKTENCNRSQVANDSRLLICPERFPGSNPGGCAIRETYSKTFLTNIDLGFQHVNKSLLFLAW